MSATTKRLDLQVGSFACSVQGFDDPVQPVRQVLQALQNLLEETPEASDLGIAFDAGEIDRLIGEVARRADLDEGNVEIVPGLIIVHRGNSNAAGDLEDDADGADADGGEAWSQPFIAGGGDSGVDDGDAEPLEALGGVEAPQADAEEDAEPGYVNIFRPAERADSDTGADAGADTGADTGADAGADAGAALFAAGTDGTPEADQAAPDDDPFATLRERINTGSDTAETGAEAGETPDEAPVRNIFADAGLDSGENSGNSVFADPMAANIAAEPEDSNPPVNLFADSADEASEADEAGEEIMSLAASRDVFAGAGSADADDTEYDDLGEVSEESGRGEALFGRSEDQPEAEEVDEGYTAAGIAEAAGATAVADLMVSAAAWMVLIQGQTAFSRNEVIKVFESIPGEHSKTLEARIKGFGKAVRNGHLIMIEDGVFGLSRTELDRFQSLL